MNPNPLPAAARLLACALLSMVPAGCTAPSPPPQPPLRGVSMIGFTPYNAAGQKSATRYEITGSSVSAITTGANGRSTTVKGRNMEEVLRKMKAGGN